MTGGRAIAGAAAVLLAASALGGSAGQDGAARGSSLVLYEGARLITGDGSPPIEDGALLVRGATIERVGVRSAVKAPSGARHVDLRGKTVMPLIMDVHGHIGYLKDGVTDKANYSRENVLDHLRRYMY